LYNKKRKKDANGKYSKQCMWDVVILNPVWQVNSSCVLKKNIDGS